MNVIMYGISYDEGTKKVHRLRGGLNVEKGLAFKKLFDYGITSKRVLDIMINEAARGRLDLTDERTVYDCETVVSKCLGLGLSTTKIIVLRSLYYSFEEIRKMSSEIRKKDLSEWIYEEGLEDAEIEAVYGVTTNDCHKEYVNFLETEKLLAKVG